MTGKIAMIFKSNALYRQLYKPNSMFMVQIRRNVSEKSAEKDPLSATESINDADSSKISNSETDKTQIELNTLKEQFAEITDKYKRSLAESENMRIRLNKQIADAKMFGIQSFCKDVIDVADTLRNATMSVPENALKEDNPHLKNLYEGLKMTQNALLHVFKRNGLEDINPINEKFDPNFHEALFQKPDNKVQPDTVIEVTKLGYKLHGRVIRPALVGVSREP